MSGHITPDKSDEEKVSRNPTPQQEEKYPSRSNPEEVIAQPNEENSWPEPPPANEYLNTSVENDGSPVILENRKTRGKSQKSQVVNQSRRSQRTLKPTSFFAPLISSDARSNSAILKRRQANIATSKQAKRKAFAYLTMGGVYPMSRYCL